MLWHGLDIRATANCVRMIDLPSFLFITRFALSGPVVYMRDGSKTNKHGVEGMARQVTTAGL